METVVLESRLRDLLQRRHVDRPAKRAGRPKTDVVDQHDNHVRGSRRRFHFPACRRLCVSSIQLLVGLPFRFRDWQHRAVGLRSRWPAGLFLRLSATACYSQNGEREACSAENAMCFHDLLVVRVLVGAPIKRVSRQACPVLRRSESQDKRVRCNSRALVRGCAGCGGFGRLCREKALESDGRFLGRDILTRPIRLSLVIGVLHPSRLTSASRSEPGRSS